MQITFYRNLSDMRQVPKQIELIADKNGTLRDMTNVQNPVILCHENVIGANYCYIPDFSRYYYIESVNIIRTGLYEFTCKCDVLQSFIDTIAESDCTISRATNGYNAYVPDSNRKFFTYTEPQYITIGDLGKNYSILMVTVG